MTWPARALGALTGRERGALRVTRSRRPVRWLTAAMVVAVLVLAYLPYAVEAGTIAVLSNVLILLTMATCWNLLAGYAGLVSVGQQAFVGLGAYAVLVLAQRGLSPFESIPIAAVVCGAVAVPLSWLLFRLRGGYFAIATWVVADACALIIGHFPELGGGTGAALPGMTGIDPVLLTAVTYWAALAVAVVTLLGAYLLLRGRTGLALTAIRDDEVAARSAGVHVSRTKRLVYLLAAAGTGAAGAVLVISQLNVQPASAFSVAWSAQMIFVVIIGGIGTIEGPILGTLLYFALQQALAGYGAWYLVVLGAVAIVIALFAPRGLWGLIADWTGLRLFPVSYWLWAPGVDVARPLRRREQQQADAAGVAERDATRRAGGDAEGRETLAGAGLSGGNESSDEAADASDDTASAGT